MVEASVVLTIVQILIGLGVQGAIYWKRLKKEERERLIRLKQEVRGNLNALGFAGKAKQYPALGTAEFQTLAGNLSNTAATNALKGNFKAERPKAAGEKKQALIRYARYALRYTEEQVDSLKKLAAYREGQKLPAVRLKTRLDTLADHLERLDKILAVIPVKLPERKNKTKEKRRK